MIIKDKSSLQDQHSPRPKIDLFGINADLSESSIRSEAHSNRDPKTPNVRFRFTPSQRRRFETNVKTVESNVSSEWDIYGPNKPLSPVPYHYGAAPKKKKLQHKRAHSEKLPRRVKLEIDIPLERSELSESFDHHMDISSAKSADYNNEFTDDLDWFGNIVKKHAKHKKHISFSILGHSLHKLDNEASIDGSSIFQDSDISKSDAESVDKIFEETIHNQEIDEVTAKIKTKHEIYNGSFGYNNYAECEEKLRRGIFAIKHNYTNGECKQVVIKLS